MTETPHYQDRDWLNDQYIIQEKSAPKIAKICNCSDTNIRNWLRKFKITIRDLSAASKGRTLSKETREKISLAMQGEKNPFYGKKHTEESKKKMSEIHKGNIPWNKGKTSVFSAETLKKMSEVKKGENNVWFGKHHTEETKKKISEAKKGYKMSEETKQKLSKAHTGKKLSEETKKKLSLAMQGEKNPFYGKKHTKETLEYLSKINKGIKKPEGFGQKVSKGLKGKPKSKEHNEAVSRALKGRVFSKEHRENLSSALSGENHPNYGKHRTEETKKKISANRKGKRKGVKLSEEHKRKISETLMGRIFSEETRRKISIALKGNKNPMWNPNREEIYAPYGENFYNDDLKVEKWELQHGRDLLTGERLKEGKNSHYHHIDYDKANDDPNNHCWLSINNHMKITAFQNTNPIKAEYYKKLLQKNTILIKHGKIPKNWKSKNIKLFKQEKLIQLKIDDSLSMISEESD